MDHQCASMSRMHRAVVVVAMALLVLGDVPSALAQQTTPTAPKAQAKKPSTLLPAPPATSQPAAPPVTAQPQGPDLTKQQFIFSPWTKICGKDGPEGSNAKDVCAVLTEARVPSGQIAVSASLVEPRDGSQKILRVTLPLGVRLPYGTRVLIDQGAPLQSNYLMCLVGCFSDYEAKPDMVEKLKKGQTLTVQAINPGGYQISIDVPLMDFAKANDGPPTDEKVLIERERKLEEELARRAEETRNKLEGQPPQAAQSSGPFTAPANK
jgi:invasion protein IalB